MTGELVTLRPTSAVEEERVRNIHDVTKVPFENKIGKVPHVLVHISSRESLSSPMDKDMERLTLSIPSAEDLQEAGSNSPRFQCVLVETTMPTTNAPDVCHMPPLLCHEMQNTSVSSLQLVEFMDTKISV